MYRRSINQLIGRLVCPNTEIWTALLNLRLHHASFLCYV